MKPWVEHIRKLEISSMYAYQPPEGGLTVTIESDSDRLRIDRFVLGAGRLLNLRSLVITNFDWTTASLHPTTFGRFSSLRALEDLVLCKVQFPTFGALRQILVSLPQLSRLALNSTTWPPTRTQHVVAPAPSHERPAIVDLNVADDCDGYGVELFTWLALTQTNHSIRKLAFDSGIRAWPQSCIYLMAGKAHLVTKLSYAELDAGTYLNH